MWRQGGVETTKRRCNRFCGRFRWLAGPIESTFFKKRESELVSARRVASFPTATRAEAFARQFWPGPATLALALALPAAPQAVPGGLPLSTRDQRDLECNDLKGHARDQLQAHQNGRPRAYDSRADQLGSCFSHLLTRCPPW